MNQKAEAEYYLLVHAVWSEPSIGAGRYFELVGLIARVLPDVGADRALALYTRWRELWTKEKGREPEDLDVRAVEKVTR